MSTPTTLLIDQILDTDNSEIDQEQIDCACLHRLKFLCGDYGDDGARARKLLDIAADMIDLIGGPV